MTDDFHTQFVKANANVDFIAYQLSAFLRNCMRAAVSNDSTSQRYEAGQNFKFVLELISHAENVRLYELIEKAVEHIRVEKNGDRVDDAIVRAAQKGVRLLTELSCDDNAARGRAAKRQDEFLRAIEWIEEEREERRRKFRPEI